jgi:hypothetical protein
LRAVSICAPALRLGNSPNPFEYSPDSLSFVQWWSPGVFGGFRP